MSESTLNLSKTPKKPTKHPVKPSKLPPLDWAAPHSPLTGTLSVTTGCAATALAGTAAGMPEGWPLIIGAAGALGHGIGASLARRLTGRSLVTRAASWLLAGGWTTWAMTTGPLTWAAAGSLAALGVGIGTMASHAAAHEEAAEEERLSAEARAAVRELSAEREALAHEWEERIARVCRVQVRVFAVQKWSTGAGYSLAAELPGGGATWDLLAQHARALATDARLPLGCAIGVEEGDTQGRVVFDIPTENVMAKDAPYPADYSALSLLTGIPWGLHPHSDPVVVLLREACALILGPPGSGKSTFLDGVLAGFARCVDVVTWVIDFKAGAVGLPWVRPWLEAQGYRQPKQGSPRPPNDTGPGIDWLATTPAEALLMLEAALAINAARQGHYQDLMDAADTTLLPISRQIPQIEIVVDEGAELLSQASFADKTLKKVQENVTRAMRTTRAMGIRFVFTAVDGNVSAIGNTEVRKFSPVNVALTSGESGGTNVAKLFGRVRIDTGQLTSKGAGVVGQRGADGFPASPFKGWTTSPSMVREAVLATNHLRPALDEPSATAAGTAYSQRWEPHRAGWLWENHTIEQQQDDPEQDTETNNDDGGGGGGGGGLNLSYKHHQPTNTTDGSGSGSETDADALAARFRKQLDATFGTAEEPHRADHPGLNLSYKQPRSNSQESESNDARAAALMLLIAAGPAGTGASAMERELKETFGTRRPVIQRWLKEWADSGEIVRVGEGSKARYVHRQHTNNPPEND